MASSNPFKRNRFPREINLLPTVYASTRFVGTFRQAGFMKLNNYNTL